jgi:formate dehydrogenase iron-sulfur subunit
MKLFVPRDAAARALGADAVAAAVGAEAARRGIAIDLVRNGSRGMFWLEPLLEVETAAGRIGFGPVSAADVPTLFDAEFGDHPRAVGPVEEIPFFARQDRLTFARVGRIDPLSLADYEAHGGLSGLRRALGMDPPPSSPRSRRAACAGAAARASRPASSGRRCAPRRGPRKYIVCNADEGDSAAPSPTAC